MKKQISLLTIALLAASSIFAQNTINIHQGNSILYQTSVSGIDYISLQDYSSVFNLRNGLSKTFTLSSIDSITFTQEPAPDVIYITYNDNQAIIVNPFEDLGINITANQAHVSITATNAPVDIEYFLSGNSENGSLTIQSNQDIHLTLSNLQLSNPVNPAIQITSETNLTINAEHSNQLSDGSGNTKNAALIAKGALIFGGNGSLQITGKAKHAISSSKSITIENANITIPAAVSDGFHSESFDMKNGSLNVNASGDGIDAGAGTFEITGGSIQITSSADDVKGIKCDSTLTVSEGTVAMTVSGAQSKGLSSKKDIFIHNGNVSIITSGAAVLNASGNGYDPSYCTAIKSDGTITINNGNILIESKSSARGGKGLSADGDITVNNGNITISTSGDGSTYKNQEGISDSYTACCIKSNKNIYLLNGNITCSSSGTGGKAIAADGNLTIGILGNADDNLMIDAATSGQRFLVSGSSGGGGGFGGGGGNNADYANPKAIKCEGNLTINSGTIRVNCTQTTEGGEGIESKSVLTIHGGDIEIHTYDDCINAANHIAINGGTTYCVSSGNDAIDSNGTLTITGGFTIANGTKQPEEGFDCDNNTFSISGGTIIGTGGATSNPTTNACTQPAIKYTGTANRAICIKKSSGEIILLYQMPAFPAGGTGGGPGGGNSSSMVVLFTDPNLSNGNYILQYGGTITGGVSKNGYNTGGSYEGGSSKSFTVNSMLTNIQ
jgi:hypothetical protein